ncbi:MAG TPA: M20/M25/M40 family metallo-hydrolase, partial [Gemmatimonadaceae bacterium]
AHLGFVWIEITVHGRAAHGSRWELGIDAIRHAGLLLAELDRIETNDLPRQSHPLLGRPSIHASTISGGSGMSTYPDRCTIRVERRTLPGETPQQVFDECLDACARVTSARRTFHADVTVMFSQAASDVPVDSPIVRALSEALRGSGETVRVEGMTAWTDAALLNAAGVPAICFGPGDIALAHSANEWVPVAEIERATGVLTRLAVGWCGQRGNTWRN